MPGRSGVLARYLPAHKHQDSSSSLAAMNGGQEQNKMTGNSSRQAKASMGSSSDDPETASDPSQIQFLPRTDRETGTKSLCGRWTQKERYLLLLSATFFILCIAFVIVAFTRDLQYKNSHKNLCMSKECVSTAAQLLSGMDLTADPCEDFYEYACGQWDRKHVIPDHKEAFNTFDKNHDHLQIILRELLEKPVDHKDTRATTKAKVLYQSCMNVSRIESLGTQPLQQLVKTLGGWPLIDPSWREEDFDLEDTLAKVINLYDQQLLIETEVTTDDKDSSAHVIQMDQQLLGLPSREYFIHPNSKHIEAYIQYIRDVVYLLNENMDLTNVNKQLHDMLAFETKLANVTDPNEERHDTGARYHKMTVKELQTMIPQFDVLRYLRGFILDPVTEDEPVVLFAKDYIQEAVTIIKNTSPRTVANYVLWRTIQAFEDYLSEPFQEAKIKFKRVLQGVMNKQQTRWKQCVQVVNEKVGMATGAMFIKEHFKKQSKDTALEMIHNIREAFNELLEENDWMDEQTKAVAKEKANAIKENVGYPEFLTDPGQLDNFYQNVTFTTNNFFNNLVEVSRFNSRRSIIRLRQPVKKESWEKEPVDVNAYYNPNLNDIVIPAGILQPSFYNKDFPKSLNYGGIGVVIGHEITHGFDDKGRQYDKDGNIKQWWDDPTIEAFRRRAQCFIDQYSGFKLDQTGEFVNGKITQGENIADNGGLKQSYRAYRKWVQHNGEELQLPGIGLNHNQLFFLNYAQIWCGKVRDEEALRKSRTSTHSPGPIRVLGPLSNSKEFAEAYNCPLGSRMNPTHKCSVW